MEVCAIPQTVVLLAKICIFEGETHANLKDTFTPYSIDTIGMLSRCILVQYRYIYDSGSNL